MTQCVINHYIEISSSLCYPANFMNKLVQLLMYLNQRYIRLISPCRITGSQRAWLKQRIVNSCGAILVIVVCENYATGKNTTQVACNKLHNTTQLTRYDRKMLSRSASSDIIPSNESWTKNNLRRIRTHLGVIATATKRSGPSRHHLLQHSSHRPVTDPLLNKSAVYILSREDQERNSRWIPHVERSSSNSQRY